MAYAYDSYDLWLILKTSVINISLCPSFFVFTDYKELKEIYNTNSDNSPSTASSSRRNPFVSFAMPL